MTGPEGTHLHPCTQATGPRRPRQHSQERQGGLGEGAGPPAARGLSGPRALFSPQKEEENRKREEKRRAEEERQQLEQERQERELREAARREQRYREEQGSEAAPQR